MNQNPRYVVLNNHTLGYIYAEQPGLLGVLASKPQLGGHDPMNGPVSIGDSDQMRAATLNDFAFYRIQPEGHIV